MTHTVGFVGLGKLGLPVGLATESRGFRVIGTDPSPRVAEILRTRRLPYLEAGAQDMLVRSRLQLVTMADLVAQADLVFVAVQTPHEERFEGVTPLTDERADFDYQHLRDAMEQLVDALAADPDPEPRTLLNGPVRMAKGRRPLPVAIISTCLPGTFQREVAPILERPITTTDKTLIDVVYNPFFIAMGTTVRDFLEPEFVLVGTDNGWGRAAHVLGEFYRRVHNRPLVEMDIVSAELTKVAYNAAIGQKIVLANAIMEIAHRMGANCDHVTDALAMSTERVVSPAYMRGGMGDGGGCHPRDNIALSWLARDLGLSCDPFGSMMEHREAQTRWLADMAVQAAVDRQLPITVLGRAYKPETNLTVGSPATLLHKLIRQSLTASPFGRTLALRQWDPRVDEPSGFTFSAADKQVFVIATRHPEFACYDYPRGSIVIDPFRYVEDKDGVDVRRVGGGVS